MHYILTQEERDAMVPKAQLDLAHEAITAMRAMIVQDRCIHTGRRFDYCDHCPLSAFGGAGDNRPSPELSKVMCDLGRSYSK